MPKISVLVPAYKPGFLDLCIASVLAQTYCDYELLIGDDSEGEEVESVVSKWSDPRIWYGRNPLRYGSGESNINFLTDRATGDYIKYLWHDDFLQPRSLELLHAVVEASKATMVFHGRHFVDASGRIIGGRSPIPDGQFLELRPAQLLDLMIRHRNNFVGEPSNILVSAPLMRSRPELFGTVDGRRMRFLTDVALYTNLAAAGEKIVGCGFKASSFRIHGTQNSSEWSAIFSAGLFEWEFFNRWAVDRGLVTADGCSETIQSIQHSYENVVDRFPELQRFLDTGTQPEEGRFMTSRFTAALEAGWSDIDARRAGERQVEQALASNGAR